MSRGATAQGRRRALKGAQKLGVPPLLRGEDHGSPVILDATAVSEDGRTAYWAESFLVANRDLLDRLSVRGEVVSDADEIRLLLHPGGRIGAVPLRAPSTRKTAAGLVIAPRMGWDRVGHVLADVQFRVEPEVGGAGMVPGSAREVPPWVLAGPVLRRVARLLRHLSRGFEMRTVTTSRLRGTVDWTEYAARSIPSGRWDQFRCTFPELEPDAWLLSALRWTLDRIRDDLDRVPDSLVARLLLRELGLLRADLGLGPAHRPSPDELGTRTGGLLSESLLQGLEAVGWISEERGLGGARSLDGLPWSLQADNLWEAWLEAFVEEVVRRIGGRMLQRDETRRRLVWRDHPSSLRSLAPDLGIYRADKTVWIDAKYKLHLQLLDQQGWERMGDDVRAAHRADVHQALAYAALAETDDVDTILAYPLPGTDPTPRWSEAWLGAGRRRTRLILAGLPFGFGSAAARETALQRWQDELAPSSGP